MTEPDSQKSGREPDAGLKSAPAGTTKDPDWTSGLKRLYDSVLEEPMPESFKDLLARLDDDHTR